MGTVQRNVPLGDVHVEPSLEVNVINVNPEGLSVGLSAFLETLVAILLHFLSGTEVAHAYLLHHLIIDKVRSVTTRLDPKCLHSIWVILIQQSPVVQGLTALLRGQLTDNLVGVFIRKVTLALLLCLVYVGTSLSEPQHRVQKTRPYAFRLSSGSTVSHTTPTRPQTAKTRLGRLKCVT